MKVYPCAKINLGLNVVSKRPDGYHNLETVFYPIGVYDELTITETNNVAQEYPCMLTVAGLEIDGDLRRNLIVRAYDLLAEHFKLPNVKVNLIKNIPMQAGLGGGSSDCAYMISTLNEMFGLGLKRSDMQQFATQLGADCAFFIDPRPSYAEGIGEIIEPISVDLSRYTIVVIKPAIAISTREAFENICPKHPLKCCRDIMKRPVEKWKGMLINDFEESVVATHPLIGDLKQRLYDAGAAYAAMSGSGSALFGLFETVPPELDKAFEGCRLIITKTFVPKAITCN